MPPEPHQSNKKVMSLALPNSQNSNNNKINHNNNKFVNFNLNQTKEKNSFQPENRIERRISSEFNSSHGASNRNRLNNMNNNNQDVSNHQTMTGGYSNQSFSPYSQTMMPFSGYGGYGMGMGFGGMGGYGGGGLMMGPLNFFYSINYFINSITQVLYMLGMNSHVLFDSINSIKQLLLKLEITVRNSEFRKWLQQKSKKSKIIRYAFVLISMFLASQTVQIVKYIILSSIKPANNNNDSVSNVVSTIIKKD